MPMQSSWLPKNKRKRAIRIKSKQKKKKERKRSKTKKAPFKSLNIEPLFWMIYCRSRFKEFFYSRITKMDRKIQEFICYETEK